jgi:hypothetical protein
LLLIFEIGGSNKILTPVEVQDQIFFTLN